MKYKQATFRYHKIFFTCKYIKHLTTIAQLPVGCLKLMQLCAVKKREIINWARRTSWGWWDEWDDTALLTQDSKFEPWWSLLAFNISFHVFWHIKVKKIGGVSCGGARGVPIAHGPSGSATRQLSPNMASLINSPFQVLFEGIYCWRNIIHLHVLSDQIKTSITHLINNFWSSRSIFRAVAIIPADGTCKITWKTVEKWRLNWRLNE